MEGLNLVFVVTWWGSVGNEDLQDRQNIRSQLMRTSLTSLVRCWKIYWSNNERWASRESTFSGKLGQRTKVKSVVFTVWRCCFYSKAKKLCLQINRFIYFGVCLIYAIISAILNVCLIYKFHSLSRLNKNLKHTLHERVGDTVYVTNVTYRM